MGDSPALSGPVVAATYEAADGAIFGHHVREIDVLAVEGGYVSADPVYACVEHAVTNCVGCGRTPGEFADGDECQHDEARPPCGCTLPRGAA